MSLNTRFSRISTTVAALLVVTIFGANSSSAKSIHHKSVHQKNTSHHHIKSSTRNHSSNLKAHGSSESAHSKISHQGASGKATIYSDRFNGKKTANGEQFRQDKVTAASPTLPLGTRVKVTNKKTGQSVNLKINDRQPRGGNRVVDLSKAAANKVGIKGTGNVQTKVLGK